MKNVIIPIDVGSFIEIDFGEFSNAVNNLLQNGINRYLPDRFHKYKIIKDILSIKNEFSTFWIVFRTLLEKNFNYDKEFRNFCKNTMDVSKLNDKDFDCLKKKIQKEIIYEYFVFNQFDLLCNQVYYNITNVSSFDGIKWGESL